MLAPMEGYKTLKELAARWHRSQPTLRQQIASGALKAEKSGRDWFVTDEEAARYEREHLGKRGRASPRYHRKPKEEHPA
jgi:hypothetical protein